MEISLCAFICPAFLEDKTAACFALMGALKAQKTWSVRECSIECCTGNNCNKQTPNLDTGDRKRVFTPEGNLMETKL